MMRKVGLENKTQKKHIEGKRTRGNPCKQPNKFVQIYGKIWTGRDSKETNITLRYKG